VGTRNIKSLHGLEKKQTVRRGGSVEQMEEPAKKSLPLGLGPPYQAHQRNWEASKPSGAWT